MSTYAAADVAAPAVDLLVDEARCLAQSGHDVARIVPRGGAAGELYDFGLAVAEREKMIAPAIAAAFKEEDRDVVGQAVDQCDGARGGGEDGVPALERQVGGDEQGAVLVPAADELKEQTGFAGVVGEVADLIDHEERRPACSAGGAVRGRVRSPVR